MIIQRNTQSYFLIKLPFHLSNMKPQVGDVKFMKFGRVLALKQSINALKQIHQYLIFYDDVSYFQNCQSSVDFHSPSETFINFVMKYANFTLFSEK